MGCGGREILDCGDGVESGGGGEGGKEEAQRKKQPMMRKEGMDY